VLRESGRYEPIVIVPNAGTLSVVNLASLHAEEITCLGPKGKLLTLPSETMAAPPGAFLGGGNRPLVAPANEARPGLFAGTCGTRN